MSDQFCTKDHDHTKYRCLWRPDQAVPFREQEVTLSRGTLYDLLTTLHHAQHELSEKRYRAAELYLADAYGEAARLTYPPVDPCIFCGGGPHDTRASHFARKPDGYDETIAANNEGMEG